MRAKVGVLTWGKKVMSNAHLIQTGIEVGLIALVVLGIVYEPVLVAFEKRAKEKVLRAFKERKALRR